MTLATITLYCTEADVQRIMSVYGVAKRLDDVCSIQQVRITGTPLSGSYTLTYATQTTDAIAFNGDQYDVQAALRNLIGLENTIVDSRGTNPNFFHRIKLVDVVGPASAITATNGLSGGTIAIAQVVTGSAQALDDSIIEATEELNRCLEPRYLPAMLATSNYVNRAAALLATASFAARRGLPVPESFTERLEKEEERLNGYMQGWFQLPGVPMRRSYGPMGSNQRVQPRYSFRALRTERSTSTGPASTEPERARDWQDAFIGPYEVY